MNNMEQSSWFVKPSDVVVIHPGCKNLRIGLASESSPRIFPHCVARRQKQASLTEQTYLPQTSTNSRVVQFIDDKAEQLTNLLSSCLTSTGVERSAVQEKQTSTIGDVKLDVPESYYQPKQDAVFGEDALNLHPNSGYNLSWPLRKGRLNVRKGPGGSLTALLHDIHDIWKWAIEEQMGLKTNALNVILIIGDVYVGEHVKRIVDMLFNEMEFKRLFVHLEGVCGAFGAGMPTGCVVDVGDSKSLVTCIEDGISLKSTRLLLEFGGADITQLMYHLTKKSIPASIDTKVIHDARLVERMKEAFCHLNLDHCGSVEGCVTHQRPNSRPRDFQLTLYDEAIVSVLGIFAPEIFALTGPKTTHLQAPQAADPQDPHDDYYILQTQRKRGDVEFDEPEDEDGLPSDLKDPIRQETIPLSQTFGLDIAILQSIDRCESDELKKKMLSNIILLGGGLANYKGVATWLRNRLASQMPKSLRGEPIEIIVQPKDFPGDCCVWRGAALITQLDTSQELWISAKEWRRYGSKILRERAVFGW